MDSTRNGSSRLPGRLGGFAPEQLYEASRGMDLPVEVLVNNAGFGTYGPFTEADLTATLQLLQVNVVALTYLTRLILPGMLERHRGRSSPSSCRSTMSRCRSSCSGRAR